MYVNRKTNRDPSVLNNPQKNKEDYLVNCFEPCQPLRIISGLKETFIKRYTVERTNKAETRPGEQSEKAKSFKENSWNEYS